MSDYTNTIQTMYITYFNRPADVAGLANWETYVAGMSVAEAEAALMAAFETSAEYAIVFDGMTAAEVAAATAANAGSAEDLANKIDAANAFTASVDATYSGAAANAVAAAWMTTIDAANPSTAESVAAAVAGLAGTEPDPVDPDPVDPTDANVTEMLTTKQDAAAGGTGDDTFNAYVFNNSNTLQSGDMIAGGSGNDTLNAQLGNSAAFAVSAVTTSVENVFINARSDSRDSNDNNLQNNFVQIDAAEMMDVQQWGTDGSRADVVIEDIRIANNEITHDITFTMRDTDAGSNADGTDGFIANDTQVGASLHAYFDANSLRNATTASAGTLTLELVDGLEWDSVTPLLNHYNDTLVFFVGTTEVTLQSFEIGTAETYVELVDAMNAALATAEAADSDIADLGIEIAVGNLFSTINRDGDTVQGNQINITAPGQEVIADRWSSEIDEQPVDLNMIYQVNTTGFTTSSLLITSDVIVDNVGRGSEGGDLEIGTMSTRGGVQQFEVVVEDSSWLNNMRSTNEALQVVNITSSTVAADTVAADGAISDGDLVIGAGMQDGADNLTDLRTSGGHVQTNGLVDVRTMDATSFANDLYVGASLTDNSMVKYLHPIESSTVDDSLMFTYNTGVGNDRLNLSVDADLAADSDFALSIATNGGNDMVMTDIDTTSVSTANWYTSHAALRNISIDTGAGDDTVATLGDGNVTITTGAGNDTVYADNTGAQINAAVAAAQAALTAAIAAVAIPGAETAAEQLAIDNAQQVLDNAMANIVTSDIAGLDPTKAIWTANNLAADNQISTLDNSATAGFGGIKGQVQVTFNPGSNVGLTGVQSAWINIDYNATTMITSAANVRDAIEDAINNDPELSKLLVVKDGPADTFVVQSLIDGTMAAADLIITTRPPVAVADLIGSQVLSATEIAQAAVISNNLGSIVPANGAFNSAGANGAYIPALAQDNAATNLAGLESGVTSMSDNRIDGGGGDDVLVLGTTVASSNDTVVFTGSFGTDTIVNFDTAAAISGGEDLLDFTSYMDLKDTWDNAAPGTLIADGQIDTTITVDTVGLTVEQNEIFITNAGLLNVAPVIANNVAAVTNAVVLAIHVDATVNTNGITYADASRADVYTATGAIGAAPVLTYVGTIDMVDVGVATLTAADFVTF